MPDSFYGTDAELVASQFTVRCGPRPTPDQVEEWQARHPEHAVVIAEFAEAMLASPSDGSEVASEAEVDEGVIDVMMRITSFADADASLHDVIAEAGLSVPGLARSLDVARSLLADVASGRVIPPVGTRLSSALAGALKRERRAVEDAIDASFSDASAMHASAEGEPEVTSRTYADAVRASGMTDERKVYWLEED